MGTCSPKRHNEVKNHYRIAICHILFRNMPGDCPNITLRARVAAVESYGRLETVGCRRRRPKKGTDRSDDPEE